MKKFWIVTYDIANSGITQQFYTRHDREELAKAQATTLVNQNYKGVFIGMITQKVIKSDPPVTFVPLENY